MRSAVTSCIRPGRNAPSHSSRPWLIWFARSSAYAAAVSSWSGLTEEEFCATHTTSFCTSWAYGAGDGGCTDTGIEPCPDAPVSCLAADTAAIRRNILVQ